MRCRVSILGLACLQAAGWPGAPAWADTAVVGPGLGGNALNPMARLGAGQSDPAGLSPYRQPASRTPSGTLYELPPLPPRSQRMAVDWDVSAFAELGWLGAGAGERNPLFRQYRDQGHGVTLNRFDAQAYQPRSARFVELRGGGVGRDDAYYGLQFGRYNDYRVSLSLDQTPHVSATAARPMWQGVGSGQLTLTPADGVAAGGASTNNAANAAA